MKTPKDPVAAGIRGFAGSAKAAVANASRRIDSFCPGATS
jgi:hypothetical protein